MDTSITTKLDSFFTKYSSRTCTKGDILIRAGEEPKGIFYLVKGNIRQYVITKDGEEMTLNIYKPFAFFPMAWAVNAYPNTYYFEAMNDGMYWIAPKSDVLDFINREPDIVYDLLKRVYVGLEGILSRMEHLMSGKAIERLLTVLVISAKRFGESDKDTIIIRLKLTHQDLANLAGLSRETVSREMNELKQKGLLEYTSSSIIINNVLELERELKG